MDYINFLKNRSDELIPGGILILTIPSLNDQGQCGNQNSKDLLYKCTIPSHIRPYDECIDENIFDQFSFRLIKAEFHNMSANFYEQWQVGQITLDQFARYRTEFMRPWCELILKTALEMNKQR